MRGTASAKPVTSPGPGLQGNCPECGLPLRISSKGKLPLHWAATAAVLDTKEETK